MNIMWHKTEMEQKNDRERWADGGWGGGGGGGAEREWLIDWTLIM